jgi:hypothetical protein
MANAIMQSPDFSGFERFSPPFGIILYYIFTFVVMVCTRHGHREIYQLHLRTNSCALLGRSSERAHRIIQQRV